MMFVGLIIFTVLAALPAAAFVIAVAANILNNWQPKGACRCGAQRSKP